VDFSYESIKQLARQHGRPVTDYIALAPANDPFYTGTPGEKMLAEWFASFYYSSYGAGTRVHVRRCHYKILSLSMSLPDGRPYENTESSWNTLLLATKAARYLRLVPVEAFEDKRNDDPQSFTQDTTYDPSIYVYGDLYSSDLQLPEFPALPNYSIDAYTARQPYRVEIWAEKTTMNDVLIPLCQQYGLVLQTGAGELSITATKALAERIAASGKAVRLFYISDFDPAGQSMPLAVSRKLEYFLRTEGLDADVRLFPVVLTAQQVARYNLPRTPIKDTERRKGSFETRHGQGATELDALEALNPGELRRVLIRHIESYYDTTLEARTSEARAELERDLRTTRREVIERYSDQIEAARAELEQIRADFGPRMEAYSNRIQALWQAISRDLEEAAPDIDAYPLPEARPAREIGDGLYNSSRDYLEQIEEYKRFQQGK
jgi:hypothetical protein